jgi:hypothetical protein
MKIKLPLMIQDPIYKTFSKVGLQKWFEGFYPDQEDFFLDGPVSKRLAVIDFSPKEGIVQIDAKFMLPTDHRKMGWYSNAEGEEMHKPKNKHMFTPAFLEVCSFAMVLRTMYMFERKETLGRKLIWAFNKPQLLIVPRAGEKANAYYHRDSNSLQFFYISKTEENKPFFTCLSRDIVSHEAGHAIVDSIDPDLLDSCTPQSLAIHEAIADLTACLMAFESHTLSKQVLNANKGLISNSSAFSSIGEEIGKILGKEYGLRNLKNKKNLDPKDKDNCVSRVKPHELSQVLSGALYNVMINIHEDLKKKYAKEKTEKKRQLLRKDIRSQWEELDKKTENVEVSVSGYALAKGAERFQRMIFRALDYLPPGDVSFADYGRAMIAVDSIAYPEDSKMRDWICDEFLDRKIIPAKSSLNIETNFHFKGLDNVDLAKLYQSNWTAYWFANQFRDFLFIPKNAEFEVRPRLFLKKKYAGEGFLRELLVKVSWEIEEMHDVDSRFPKRLRVPVGTTIAIDWDTKRILARLTNTLPKQQKLTKRKQLDRKIRNSEYRYQNEDRGKLLKYLAGLRILKRDSAALDHRGKPLLSAILVETEDMDMRIRGAGKLLHIIGGGQ